MKKLFALLCLIPALCFGGAANNITFGGLNADFVYNYWVQNESLTSATLTNANDGFGVCTTLTNADSLTDLGYRITSISGSQPAAGYKVALWGITTSGLPDSTNVLATGTFTPAGTNAWTWQAFGTPYTPSQGQVICEVVVRTAASDGTTATFATGNGQARTNFQAYVTAAAGTWTHSNNFATMPTIAVRSSGGATVYGLPWTGNTLFSTTTFGATAEKGVSFTLPSNLCNTAKLQGIKAIIATPSASTTNSLVATLYSSPGSAPARVDQTIAIINNYFGNASSGRMLLEAYFTSSTAITGGTKYVLALATTTATDASLTYVTVASAADWNGWDFQQQAAFTSRTATSYAAILAGTDTTHTFSDTATQRPLIEFIFKDFTAPVGGSSGGVY